MRNVSEIDLRKIKTHNFVNHPPPQNHAVFEIIGKNVVELDKATDGNTTRPLRFVCWITKSADSHSEYVIFITFPLQQRLRERA